jgi:hypothetical protein
LWFMFPADVRAASVSSAFCKGSGTYSELGEAVAIFFGEASEAAKRRSRLLLNKVK